MAEFSSIEPQKLIEKLSHRPYEILDAMITINTWQSPPAPSALSRPLPRRISSLGVLDRLPPEITSTILGFLDLPSLAVFARASHRANDVIRSLRQYQDLLAFAPEAVEALRCTDLMRVHSAAHLHDALRSRRCATCIERGEFLFLPTGERCCWQCLRDHPLLRMITPWQARQYFCLSERHVRRLTLFTVIDGCYGIYGVYDVRQRSVRGRRLVSARAAVELGLKVHGSAENLSIAVFVYLNHPDVLPTVQNNRENLFAAARLLAALIVEFATLEILLKAFDDAWYEQAASLTRGWAEDMLNEIQDELAPLVLSGQAPPNMASINLMIANLKARLGDIQAPPRKP
ncbi:hypothetical protein CMUS01_13972 [Colletotrichum musicola]|uniref:F-box domain-containing protein n=1 Tax=Colletotrichum musicola TaxID=2175873 RepID=A0A8H6J7Q5_9PEZI|nr:hypothetical protein CMUS01_13972 [Colletotrichum musicola]